MVLCSTSFLSLQNGSNAFHLCAVGGNAAIAEFLAPMMEGHLLDVNNGGYTALHCATQEGQLSMVEYLVKSCGFDLKARDKVCHLSNILVVCSSFYLLGFLLLYGHDMHECCNT